MQIDTGNVTKVETRPNRWVDGEVVEITIWLHFSRAGRHYFHLGVEEAKEFIKELTEATTDKL